MIIEQNGSNFHIDLPIPVLRIIMRFLGFGGNNKILLERKQFGLGEIIQGIVLLETKKRLIQLH